MAETETKRRGTLGTSSLILIFIVLCLATFGLLSLSSAAGDLKLAEKNAGAVQGYYEADIQGERFIHLADEGLLGDEYRTDTGRIVTDIPMDFGQALHIELEPADGGPCRVVCYQVYNREEYGIDDSMPVWTGED